MYRVYMAVITLAAADHLSLEDTTMEFRALLDDLQCENIKPLEVLKVARVVSNVNVNAIHEAKAEATD